MQGAKIAGPGGARESIEYLCRLLAEHDIHLTAETLRQAKFDGAEVRCAQCAMWRAAAGQACGLSMCRWPATGHIMYG